MLKKPAEPEPKSWAELLKQEEARRNNPPDKSFYVRPEIVKHPEGGIFARDVEDNPELDKTLIPMDTHYYSSTSIFDPPEEKPRKYKPAHDHGLDLLTWDTRNKPFDDEEKTRTFTRIKPSYQNDEYDSITGVAKVSPFKNSVQQILKQREYSQKVMATRTFDPVSNTFPSASLEETRIHDDEMKILKQHEFKVSKLPPNERRAHENIVNIITGETKDEDVANQFVSDFTSSCLRNQRSIQMEKNIQERREREEERRTAMIANKFNTPGRLRELRDWDLISGQSKVSGMDSSVKPRPSVWQWCQQEALQ